MRIFKGRFLLVGLSWTLNQTGIAAKGDPSLPLKGHLRFYFGGHFGPGHRLQLDLNSARAASSWPILDAPKAIFPKIARTRGHTIPC